MIRKLLVVISTTAFIIEKGDAHEIVRFKELGISGAVVGKMLGLSQSAVSRSVQRGERLVFEHRLFLEDE